MTVTSTTTDTSYALQRRKRAAPTGGVQAAVAEVIARQIGSAAGSSSIGSDEAASITSALSSGCTCLNLPDPTVQVTETAPVSVRCPNPVFKITD